MENLKLHETYRYIYRKAGQCLRFCCKDRTFEVIFKLFALVLQTGNRPVGITGNNALELANQSRDYIGHKHIKLYNNVA